MGCRVGELLTTYLGLPLVASFKSARGLTIYFKRGWIILI